MYKADSKIAEEFIDHQEILDTLEYAHNNKSNRALIEQLIDKAAQFKGLSHREAALLLECDQPDLTERIFRLAQEIKHKFYGNRIVMFAPLYLSNYCVNGCVYCPYHLKNKTIARKKLTQEEIRKEVIALQDMGHKRLALEADRAMEAGIDDVGLGVLFGLNTYRYDFTGLLMHAEHLEATFGVGPHTISVPRICPADDISTQDFPDAISDDIFCKIVAVIRIAVPYTGMIISTRESAATRRKVLNLGISQISGGSRTSVGGYAIPETPEENSAQFDISDTRTLDEVVNWLLDLGHIPSFCTACYRAGRTGDRFMSLVKSGQIANCCAPNALMTLKEYLEDYAAPDTRAKGIQLIKKELEHIPNPKIKEIAIRNLKEIEEGKRDFRF